MEIGRMLIIAGAVLVIAGLIFSFFSQHGSFPRLPGDIYIKRENMTFYFPIVTSILLSIIVSVILYFFRR